MSSFDFIFRQLSSGSRRAEGRDSESGQALIEFAVLLPLLTAVIWLIWSSGSTYNHYVTLTDATRAGARMAAVSRTAADPVAVTTQAVRDSAYGLDLSSASSCGTPITVTPSPPWTTGQQVTVTATYPYQLKLFAGATVKSGCLTSSTKERIE
jgi:Flp pilus assembly protein TadG